MTLFTCLRGVTKNSSFLRFRAAFMSYCPQFWGSGLIYRVHDTYYISRGITKNSLFMRFRAVFMSHCLQFWGSGLIYKVHDTRYMFEGHDKKFIIF
jgi:hypothetical protein